MQIDKLANHLSEIEALKRNGVEKKSFVSKI